MDFSLTTPVLASNCWPATPQSMVNELWSKTRGQLQDLEGVIISASAPDVDDQDKAWIKVDGSGRPLGIFRYGAGQWLWPVQSWSTLERRLLLGTEADVWSYDGGDGTDPSIGSGPTPTTGAMWEVDHDFDGRSPLGPGAIPDSDPPQTIATAGVDGGKGTVLMTSTQVAPHTHALSADTSIEDGDNIKVVSSGSGSTGLLIGGSGNTSTPLSVDLSDPGATQEQIPVLHPVRTIWVIKRTARLFYVG